MILDIEALKIIRELIFHTDYKKIITLPTEKNYFFPLGEVENIINFFKEDKNRLYSYSIFPSLYEFLQKIKNNDLRTMFRLFFKNEYTSRKDTEKLLGDEKLTVLLEKNILKIEGNYVYSLIKITPHEGFYFLSTGPFFTDINKRVYIGPDSFLLSEDIRKHFSKGCYKKGLDMCSGSGIQTLTLSNFTKEVTGADINPNAIEFAKKNVLLNKKENIKFIQSDLYSNLTEEYDLIVSNTPFGYFPEDMENWLPGYGGEWGIEIPLKIVEGFKKHLKTGGMALVCLSSPIVNGKNLLLERLSDMFSGEKFSIKAKVIQNCLIPDLYHFHRENNVEYFKYYHMLFKKGEDFSINVEELEKFAKIEGNYGLLAQRILGYYRPYMLKKEDFRRYKILEKAEKELSLNRPKKAKKILKDIIRKKPDFGPAYMDLARIYLNEGKVDLAEEHFIHTINLMPDEIDPYCAIGSINMEKKNKKEAIKYFKMAIKAAEKNNAEKIIIELKKIIRTMSYL